ncbi:MAG: cold shock domain-containing protein [Gammaproteobacteria bacterium]|nr:cold shock domain-containing protein [Gammaproteobacteria bacterium]
MEGKIKWFSKEKGYGFISVPNSQDRFFHVTNIIGDDLPNNGDIVTFKPETRKDGKLSAVRVSITKAKKKENEKPYYASGEYKSYSYTNEGTQGTWGFWLAVIFAIITFWWLDGGIWWILFSAFVGFVVGVAIGKEEEKVEGSYEITSKCLRCSGTGHVTARSNNNIGFQCENCKNFWKERDKYGN